MRRFNPLRYAAVILAVCALSLCVALAGCGSQQQEAEPTTPPAEEPQSTEVHVASLKGPTSIGLVSFMDQAEQGTYVNDYDFTIATAADEILPNVIKGDVDIALVPTNAAAVLYNKTDGGVVVIDINTLGVLNVVTGDEQVKTFDDLAGKTIYLTGKGATPEYAVSYLLGQAGIADSVTLEFKDEPAEVVAVLAQDPSAVGVLPQPFATVATTKNESLSIALDLTDVWDTLGENGSQLVTGVTVARRAFVEEHPEAVAEFIMGQTASVNTANDEPDTVAPLVVKAGIIDNEAIAAKAIPGCHLVCLTGEDLKTALSGYLQTLFEADPASVGGSLPADDFYYAE